MCLVVTCV